MTAFDYTVLAVVGLSIVVSLMRGAVREIISLLGWLIAFYVARTFSAKLLPYLPDGIPTDSLKSLLVFVITFLLVLFVVSIVATVLSAIVKFMQLGWLDRGLGGVFGLTRGIVIVCVLVMLGGMTDLPKDRRWTNAMLSPAFESIVIAILPWMPKSLSKHVHLGEQMIENKTI